MPNGMTALATLTLGGSQATVTFSSIVGTYRDLMLIIQDTGSGTEGLRIRINGDTGSNYSYVLMAGDGSSASSGSGSMTELIGGLVYSASISNSIYHFMDYSATDKHKTVLSRNNNASVNTVATAQRWASTAAITTLLVYPTAGTFAAGSIFTLYGVSA